MKELHVVVLGLVAPALFTLILLVTLLVRAPDAESEASAQQQPTETTSTAGATTFAPK